MIGLETSFESLAFHVLAGLALASAVAVVGLVRDLRGAAFGLLVCLLSLAGIHALLSAELVAVLSIALHAGVVVALLIFATMLVDPDTDEMGPPLPSRTALKLVGAIVALALGLIVVSSLAGGLPAFAPPPAGFGGQRLLGLALFREHWLAVELCALVLLAAMVGSLILAKRRLD